MADINAKAIIEDLAANPRDKTKMVAYSDFFEERGDSRTAGQLRNGINPFFVPFEINDAIVIIYTEINRVLIPFGIYSRLKEDRQRNAFSFFFEKMLEQPPYRLAVNIEISRYEIAIGQLDTRESCVNFARFKARESLMFFFNLAVDSVITMQLPRPNYSASLAPSPRNSQS